MAMIPCNQRPPAAPGVRGWSLERAGLPLLVAVETIIRHSSLLTERLDLNVSFVWFDIGYTLLYTQRETTYQKALRKFGIDVPLKDLEKEFHLTDKLFMREYPGFFLQPRDVFMPAYLGIVNHRMGVRVNLCELDACWETIKKQFENYWLPFKGVKEVLLELERRSIGLGVISNWDCTARDILRSAGLSRFFDPLIISCEVDCTKPDARIFDLALQKASAEAHRSLYVGDNYYDDCLGSRKVGMNALIINRFGSLGVEEIDDCPIIQQLSDIFEYID
jgi:putative hydrolase of the HAD superfamily